MQNIYKGLKKFNTNNSNNPIYKWSAKLNREFVTNGQNTLKDMYYILVIREI